MFIIAICSLVLFVTFMLGRNPKAEAQSSIENYYLQQGDKWLDQTTKFQTTELKKDCATIAIAYYLRARLDKGY
jgi:hypothetical protein